MARTAKRIAIGRRGKNKQKTVAHRVKENSAIVPVQPSAPVVHWKERKLSTAQVELIKRMCAKGTDDDQFSLFMQVCQRHGLDPFTHQVYCVLFPVSKHHTEKRKTPTGEIDVWVPGHEMVIITGIGGYRKMAARDHGDYAGSSDGEFTWFEPPRKTPAKRDIPRSATVKVFRRGAEATVATVMWDEYAPADLTAARSDFWNRMPCNQLEKCAEAKGLRKAFPGLGDIFTEEEMSQRLHDFTEGGRQIVTADGTSPSGLPVTYEARMRGKDLSEDNPHGHSSGSQRAIQAEGVLERVEQADRDFQAASKPVEATQQPKAAHAPPVQPPAKPQGTVEVDWADPQSPIVRGDIGNLVELIQKHCKAIWHQDWWHVLPADVLTIKEMCKEFGYEVKEVFPSKASGGVRHDLPEKTTATGRGSAGASDAAPAVVLKGVIEKVNMGMVGKNTPTREVRIGKTWHKCFSQTLHEFLDGKHGKVIGVEAEVYIQGPYKNLVGFKRLGSREFLEDGKTPVIQRDEPRGGNLFA